MTLPPQLYKMCKLLKHHGVISQFETGSTSGKFYVKVRINDDWKPRMEADELINLAGDQLRQQIRSYFQSFYYFTNRVIHQFVLGLSCGKLVNLIFMQISDVTLGNIQMNDN